MNIEEKKPKSMMVLGIVALVLTLGIMGYFLFFADDNNRETSNQIGQMQEMTQQVQGLESEVKEKQGEISELAKVYKEKLGKDIPTDFNPLDLSPEAQEFLKQRIGEEKDLSAKSLLEEILGKNNEIRDLKEKIADIEKLLPAPHIVQKGENHYQIAMNFLVNEKGLEKEQAMEMIKKTALFDELVEGFKVWNFYTGDEYGTSVTQGDANISPNMVMQISKKKLTAALDQAIFERDKLVEDVKTLEEKQGEVISQLDQVTREKDTLTTQVDDLNLRINSLFYLLDSEGNLKKKKILKSGFFTSTKLRDISPQVFNQAIDLRTNDQVLITAANLGIKKIQGVTLYPKIYKKGTGYKLEITADKRYALLTILEKEKFMNGRIVIAVEPLIERNFRRPFGSEPRLAKLN